MRADAMMRACHRSYRAAYRLHRTARTVETLASGNPRRITRLYGRRFGVPAVRQIAQDLEVTTWRERR